MALVSVVIPAYNAETYVKAAVESALRQTHTNVEVVVVDDGSADGTRDVLASVSDKRLRVVHQPNSGVALARNSGIEIGRGPFVAFLDADDVWLPTKLARQLAALEANPSWVAVGAFMHHISSSGRIVAMAGQPVGDREREQVRRARLMPFPVSSLLVKRRVLDRTGLFDPEFAKLGQVEDLDFLSRIAAQGDIGCVKDVLGGYRVHGASASARQFRLQRAGARYLAARHAARDRGVELDFGNFMASRRWWERVVTLRRDVAAFCYRSSGIAIADRRFFEAVMWALPAAALGPLRVAERLRRQRGLRYRRSRARSIAGIESAAASAASTRARQEAARH